MVIYPMSKAGQQQTTPVDGGARRAILEVAERLFSERGFDAVSVSEIALGAGVCKANVFHHYGSKQQLYMAVLKSATDRASGEVARQVLAGQGDVPERLGLFLANYLQLLIRHPHTSRLVMREVMENGERDGATLARELFSESFVHIVDLIREAQHGGMLRKDLKPELLAVSMIGIDVFFFHTRTVLRHLPGVDFAGAPEAFSRDILDLLLHGALQP